ncbi:imelysin family protein [Leucothrix arctica]|uniref:Peptidase n=1 Tax=Leucothrix arctica TaxID=1481894 RepID=A0A317C6I0_9GAMM|nr:imelysin family protein [Leucothrix arctica]PWQ94224.1 peptidase [Leucothrix arctica]
MKALISTLALTSILVFSTATAAPITPKDTMNTYVNIAHASFADSLSTAKTLKVAIDEFVSNPTTETMQDAKDAWLAARIPYGQTEAFRFANPNVDDWEGQVNAWPLDEGLIDYVDSTYEHEDGNSLGEANIIAGKEKIDMALLRSFHEKGGSEANVATGYHAIEFLLWGQDLNKSKTDAGLRTFTDYAKGTDCTNGNCDRRGEYLTAATDLLVADLNDIVADWAPEKDNYRKTFLALEANEALRRMLFGLGSLSLGELAGQRINVALLAHSQEDEHSCFSDNTHVDIAENARGIQNIYTGTYKRVNGETFKGASLAELLALKNPELSKSLTAKLAISQSKAADVVKAAESGEYFDQQIAANNSTGNARVQSVIDALRLQTGDIEAASKAFGIPSLSADSSESTGG